MLKPMNKQVILDWAKNEETTTESGIFIPSASKRGDYATVLAVHDASELEVGDQVIFNKSAGRFVEIDGDEVLIIPESEIYGVLVE